MNKKIFFIVSAIGTVRQHCIKRYSMGQNKSEYLASIEKYKTATGYSVPGEFVIGGGIK